MDNTEGKRVMPKNGMPKGAKIAVIVIAAVLVLLVGGYLALCGYVSSSDRILPGTSADVGGDLSGMTRNQAEEAVRVAAELLYGDKVISVSYPGGSQRLSGSVVTVDAAAAADQAYARGRENGFLGLGFAWLSSHGNSLVVTAAAELAPGGEETLQRLIHDIDSDISSTLTETTYHVTDDALVLRKGTSGVSVSLDALREQLLEALWAGKDSVELTPEVTAPEEPDFEAIYREVYVESADAYLDKATKEIVPSVTGVSFDIAAARALLERAEEGETCSVPLALSEPALTGAKLEENLFKDVLAETKTWCSGPAVRRTNIDLACSFVNDTILLPGETFSYTELCGPYTVAKGYGKATAYVQGKSVDTTAGGICQLSSTLYWATLVANLETVERSQHAYNTGYLPIIGTDATVYDTYPDFKFKNSTEYPVKIECYRDKSNNLHVTILGTSNGIHGEPFNKVLATEAAQTVYEANDAKVAPGGEPIKDTERTAYNGITVEVYLRLVDDEGNEVETKFLHKDKYRSRNGVYFYNSADAARLGIDPATGLRNLTPVVDPSPSVEPTPVPSTDPAVPTDPNMPTEPTPPPGTDPGAVPTDPAVTPPPSESPAGESPVPSEEPSPTPSESPAPSQDVPEGIPTIPPADAEASPAA